MPRANLRERRRAFSLIELLAVVFMFVTAVGLMASAVQQARNTARMRVESLNNLKQFSLGMHNIYSTYKKWPASVGWFPSIAPAASTTPPANHGTVFYFLLPFIEKDNIYKSVTGNSRNAGKAVVDTLIAPMDPTVPSTGITPGTKLAATSYAANWFVFQGDRQGKSGPGPGLRGITDGTSQTVMFVEWYASCGNSDRNWATDMRKTIGDLGSGFGATVKNGAPAWWGGLAADPKFTNNNGTPTPLKLPFWQNAPQKDKCDPTLVQSYEQAGIHIALCDGTARMVKKGISRATWQAIFTPSAGDLTGTDWD